MMLLLPDAKQIVRERLAKNTGERVDGTGVGRGDPIGRNVETLHGRRGILAAGAHERGASAAAGWAARIAGLGPEEEPQSAHHFAAGRRRRTGSTSPRRRRTLGTLSVDGLLLLQLLVVIGGLIGGRRAGRRRRAAVVTDQPAGAPHGAAGTRRYGRTRRHCLATDERRSDSWKNSKKIKAIDSFRF